MEQPSHDHPTQLRTMVIAQQLSTISELEGELDRVRAANAELEAQAKASGSELLQEKLRAERLEGECQVLRQEVKRGQDTTAASFQALREELKALSADLRRLTSSEEFVKTQQRLLEVERENLRLREQVRRLKEDMV
eukprot:RCo014186